MIVRVGNRVITVRKQSFFQILACGIEELKNFVGM